MKTAFLTLIGLAAFLALVLLAMWAEARVRLVDLVGFILAHAGNDCDGRCVQTTEVTP